MSPYKRNEIACLCGWLVTSLAVAAYALWCAAKRLPLWTLALMLSACGGPGKEAEVAKVSADVTACSARLTEAIFASDNCTNQADCCNQAQFRVDGLIATLPSCNGWHHFEVCGLLNQNDGGADAHD